MVAQLFARIEGQEACIFRVTEELSRDEWVHLACHGLPNKKQPFSMADDKRVDTPAQMGKAREVEESTA